MSKVSVRKTTLAKSYQITFLMLICITILVYIRSLNKKLTRKQVASLQLAGLVTSIAAFHYYYMITTHSSPVAYRYFDWFFTTPILLLDLFIILDIYDFNFFVKAVVLNTSMLLFGYLGEIRVISMLSSTLFGFIPFILLFYMIKQKMSENTRNKRHTKEHIETSQKVFYVFATLWSFYGINHLVTDTEIKNTTYNILDLCTKGIFALYLYYRTW